MTRGTALWGLGIALAMPVLAAAQVVNGTVEHRTVTSPLEQTIGAAAAGRDAVWIAYQVPIEAGHSRMCEWNQNGGGQNGRIYLEAPSMLTILARYERGELASLKTATEECAIDAGGRQVIWFDNAPSRDSAAWLGTLIDQSRNRPANRNRIVDSALSALVWHREQGALDRVIAAAKTDNRPQVRSKALFWLGQRAAAGTAATIRSAIDSEPESQVRAQAVFALSQMPKDEGVPLLIQLARTHRDVEVRRKAMFWLGQSNDPRAVAFFEDVLKR